MMADMAPLAKEEMNMHMDSNLVPKLAVLLAKKVNPRAKEKKPTNNFKVFENTEGIKTKGISKRG